MRRGFAAAALVGATTSAMLIGQVPAPQRQRPVFRTDAHFVLVDAYPLRNGRIVEGLSATDFEVREDGVPQTVEFFEFVGGGAPEPESARRDPNTVAASREAVSDPRARAFVAYLDIPHVSNDGAHRSRLPLVNFLNGVITPDDVFGVISSEHEVTSLTFGRRITSIDDQLSRYWAWGRRDSSEKSPDESGLWSCFAYTDPPDSQPRWVWDGARERPLEEVLIERQRADRALTHLEDLVWYLGSLREGRTSVLLVSEGWRRFQRDNALQAAVENTGNERPSAGRRGTQFEMFTTVAQGQRQACINEGVRLANLDLRSRHAELIRRANAMNVAFYAVNPLGLVATDSNIGDRRRGFDANTLVADDLGRVQDRRDALVSLSTETDGVAAVASNDLTNAMAPIFDQLRAFYLVGYYSTNSTFDGGLRTIAVRSSVPGVEVKARRSYRAPTPEERTTAATPPPDPRLKELAKALDLLAGIRSADDRTFNAARYLTADAAPLLGVPAISRATSSPRSPIVRVVAPAFRRNERLRVEWPVTSPIDRREGRVLGRDGKPLAALVALSVREDDSGHVLIADVQLGPLAPGEFVLEITVSDRAQTRRSLVPFKVVP
jgi:VWFA-related protein